GGAPGGRRAAAQGGRDPAGDAAQPDAGCARSSHSGRVGDRATGAGAARAARTEAPHSSLAGPRVRAVRDATLLAWLALPSLVRSDATPPVQEGATATCASNAQCEW